MAIATRLHPDKREVILGEVVALPSRHESMSAKLFIGSTSATMRAA